MDQRPNLTAGASPKLRVEHLTKVFGGSPREALSLLESGVPKDEIFDKTGNVVAVSDVSFEVGEGEIFVIMGLSGSGKSTLVRCINRLITPTSGRLFVDEEDILAASKDRLREIRLTKIAMVFQHFALFPHRSVADNAEYGLKIRGVEPRERREKALAALALVGLEGWADVPPQKLSGGMQQRVGLARALAVDPELMLMDEPFSALDPLIRRDMQAELIELQRRIKTTIVFITHDLHEALTIGHKIAVMKDGRVVQLGTPEEIVGNPADPYVSAFTQDVDRSRVFSLATIMRPAAPLALERDSVGTARARLRDAGGEAAYVVDEAGKPVGLVADEDLSGVGAGDGQGLASLMRREFPTAALDMKVADAFTAFAAGLPIAVVDGAGRLQGTVRPLDVFAELVAEAGGAEQADQRAASGRALA